MNTLSYAAFLLAFASVTFAIDSSKVACLINAQRQKEHKEPLSVNAQLTRAAQAHANLQARRGELINDSAAFQGLCEKAGYRSKIVTAVIGDNDTDEEQCVKAWSSGKERGKILSDEFYEMGSAVAYNGTTPYYTVIFGSQGKAGENVPKCHFLHEKSKFDNLERRDFYEKRNHKRRPSYLKSNKKTETTADEPRADYNYIGGKYGEDGTGEYDRRAPPAPGPSPRPGPAPVPSPGPAPGPSPTPNPPKDDEKPRDNKRKRKSTYNRDNKNEDEDEEVDEDEKGDEIKDGDKFEDGDEADEGEMGDEIKDGDKIEEEDEGEENDEETGDDDNEAGDNKKKMKDGKEKNETETGNDGDKGVGGDEDENVEENLDPKLIYGRHSD